MIPWRTIGAVTSLVGFGSAIATVVKTISSDSFDEAVDAVAPIAGAVYLVAAIAFCV